MKRIKTIEILEHKTVVICIRKREANELVIEVADNYKEGLLSLLKEFKPKLAIGVPKEIGFVNDVPQSWEVFIVGEVANLPGIVCNWQMEL